MTRVLVTRPEPGARRTLQTLKARGIDAVAIPLTEIAPLGLEAPNFDCDAIIVTSQNAITHGAALLAQYKSKPVFVVGKRTAETLNGLGHTIRSSAETAAALLPLILASDPKHIVYICGQTRRPDIEAGLAAFDVKVTVIETYAAKPADNSAENIAHFFLSHQNAIVMLHAPSAADMFVSAMKNQNLPVTTRFLCMSGAIATQLPPNWQNNAIISEYPDEMSMIDGVDKLLAQNHLPKA